MSELKLEHCGPTATKPRASQTTMFDDVVNVQRGGVDREILKDCRACQRVYPGMYAACKLRLQKGVTGCQQLF